MSFSKASKKDEVKIAVKSKSDFNYDKDQTLYRFYKGYDEFKEMSLDSKYNRKKEFNRLFINFKGLKPKMLETQPKKQRIMKNVDEI